MVFKTASIEGAADNMRVNDDYARVVARLQGTKVGGWHYFLPCQSQQQQELWASVSLCFAEKGR